MKKIKYMFLIILFCMMGMKNIYAANIVLQNCEYSDSDNRVVIDYIYEDKPLNVNVTFIATVTKVSGQNQYFSYNDTSLSIQNQFVNTKQCPNYIVLQQTNVIQNPQAVSYQVIPAYEKSILETQMNPLNHPVIISSTQKQPEVSEEIIKENCSDYVTAALCRNNKDKKGNECSWDLLYSKCEIKQEEELKEEPIKNSTSGEVDKTDISKTNISNICSMPEYRKPMKFIGIVLNFVKIIVPILIILFGVMDLYKAMTSSKEDGWRKALKSIAIRVMAGVFIFLLPGIIQMVLNMVNEWSEYKNTWCCCTDCLLNGDCDVNSCNSNSCHIEGTD